MTKQPIIRKYIDPMVDFGFKKIFKESGNKELIIRPLNVIFDLNIEDITISDSEQLGRTKEERKASFDLFCKTADRRSFVIEVQIAQQKYFLERALFYTSFPIAKSAPKDKDQRKKWDYNYPPVFFFGLMNFNLRHDNPALADPNQYIHLFTLRDEKTAELMTDRLRFAFLEVKRFSKKKEECHTFEDRFLFIMKNLPTFAEKPELWDDDPYFEQMLAEAEYANMTDKQQIAYMESLKQRWDYQNTIDYAREEGHIAGWEGGLRKGIEQGREEGRTEERIDNARSLLKLGVPIETIATGLGLTEDQIRSL